MSKTLADPVGTCSVMSNSPGMVIVLPDFSVHGIILTRILEWVAISSSRGSSVPTALEAGVLFTPEPSGKPKKKNPPQKN